MAAACAVTPSVCTIDSHTRGFARSCIYRFPVVGFKKKKKELLKRRYAKIVIHIVGVPENMENVSGVNVTDFFTCLENPRREIHWISSLPVPAGFEAAGCVILMLSLIQT